MSDEVDSFLHFPDLRSFRSVYKSADELVPKIPASI